MNKKTAISLSVFSICLLLGGYFFYKSWQINQEDKINTQNKLKKKSPIHMHHGHSHHAHHNHKHHQRKPAAIKPIDFSKYKIDKNWKDKTITSLKKNLPEDYTIELKEVSARELTKSDFTKKLVQLVTVNITHPTGAKSSYNAVVDSATGSIIQTFNQSQFEDRSFYAVKLKADYNTLDLVPLNKKQQ